MLVRLQNTETWIGELEAEITYRLPSSRSSSEARITIPRSSTAHKRDYISEDGGSVADLWDASLGAFRGFTDVPATNEAGTVLTVYSWDRWPAIRTVSGPDEFVAVPAGVIVRQAFRNSIAGAGHIGLKLGDISEGGPTISRYRFEDQYLDDVLNDMMDQSGMEWTITTEGVFHWVGLLGRYYEIPLAEDGDLVDVERAGSLADMASEVLSRNNVGHTLAFGSFTSPAMFNWPRQVVIGSGETP